MNNSNKKYTFPKFRRGQQVKIIATGSVSGVISVSYDSGHNWYGVKDQNGKEKIYAERELEPA